MDNYYTFFNYNTQYSNQCGVFTSFQLSKQDIKKDNEYLKNMQQQNQQQDNQICKQIRKQKSGIKYENIDIQDNINLINLYIKQGRLLITLYKTKNINLLVVNLYQFYTKNLNQNLKQWANKTKTQIFEQLSQLLQKIKKDYNCFILILGDFNIQDKNYIKSFSNYQNTYYKYLEELTKKEQNYFRQNTQSQNILDYILIDQFENNNFELQVSWKKIELKKNDTHNPIIITLKIEKQVDEKTKQLKEKFNLYFKYGKYILLENLKSKDQSSKLTQVPQNMKKLLNQYDDQNFNNQKFIKQKDKIINQIEQIEKYFDKKIISNLQNNIDKKIQELKDQFQQCLQYKQNKKQNYQGLKNLYELYNYLDDHIEYQKLLDDQMLQDIEKYAIQYIVKEYKIKISSNNELYSKEASKEIKRFAKEVQLFNNKKEQIQVDDGPIYIFNKEFGHFVQNQWQYYERKKQEKKYIYIFEYTPKDSDKKKQMTSNKTILLKSMKYIYTD